MSPTSCRLTPALALLALAGTAEGQPAPDSLTRHVMVGAAVAPLGADSAGVRVTGVTPGFTAERLGLEAGDVILQVDGRTIGTLIDYARAFRSWRDRREIRLTVLRRGSRHVLRGLPVPRPRETGEGIEIEYGSVVSDSGDRLRSLVTRPSGASGRLPTIVLVSWLSCATVEFASPEDRPGWQHVLHGLSRAGYLVLRVEKPGVGDSRGPDCSELGYWREVAGYRAGMEAAWKRPDVDTSAVFLFGASLGGSVAPVIAPGRPVRGILVSGTYARTWYEHILGFERRRLELSGTPPPEVHQRMLLLEELYADYLIRGRTPGEIIRRRPTLTRVWTDMPAHQFGRPVHFFQKLQRVNVAAAWDSLAVPVLVLYGAYDWMMAREDHELVARIAGAKAPGSELVIVPGMDHHFMRYRTREHAFREDGGVVAEDALQRMVQWLEKQRRGP
jgi:pimeloyl-ACP methyl ester carboxylesterase